MSAPNLAATADQTNEASRATAPSRRVDARERAAEAAAVTDVGLTAMTRTLVDHLAPSLGIAPADVTIRIGGDAGAARTIGARGLAHGHTVHLAVGAEALASAAGRGLVAHELAHVAQTAPGMSIDAASLAAELDRDLDALVADAEREARAIGRAGARGGALWRPRRRLPAGIGLADTGAAVAPKPATATKASRTDAAVSTPSVATGSARTSLAKQVAARHRPLAERLDRIADRLWVDGDDLREALLVVSPLPFLEARSLFESMKGQQRLDLAEELDDDHHRTFPSPAVALLAACPPIISRYLSADNIAGLDPAPLDALEKAAAREVLRGLNHGVLEALLTGEHKSRFRAWVAEYPGAVDETAALRTATATLAASLRAEDRELAKDEKAADTVKQAIAAVTKLLRSPTTETAREALARLANLQPAPPPSTEATPTTTTDKKPPTTSTESTPAGPPTPHVKLRRAVRALEREGRIEVLLDNLASEDRTAGSGRASELLLVLAAREPGLNLAKAESLLSYRFFDWAITDAEARYAYVLLRAVPTTLQDRFLTRDGGKWFQRLEENLPADDVLTGLYRGLGSAADPFDYATSNEVVTDAMTVVRDVHWALEKDEIDGKRAIELLRKLVDLGRRRGQTTPITPGSGHRGRLQVACSRLDALGDIDRLLEHIPDAFLYQERPRQLLLELMAAREPAHLGRSARKLLDTGFFTDWAVTAREAWIAFYMIRSLSAADQAAFKRAHPDLWSKLQGEMTTEMRRSAAIVNLGATATFETRERVRDRLRDPAVWTPARQLELRSLIIQLQAIDDGTWVFRTSREMLRGKSASDLAAMRALITERRLWQAKVREHFPADELRSPTLEGPIQFLAEAFGYLRLLPAVLQVARSAFTDTLKLEGLDLGDVAAALGGDIGGARVATDDQVAAWDRQERSVRNASTRAGKSAALAKEANRLGFTIDPGDGVVTVTLPRLEIASMNRAFTGMSIRTGRISLKGLKLVASFSDRGYARPVGAEADIADAKVDDTTVAGQSLPGGVLAATMLGLSTLHLRTGALGTEDLTADRDDDWVSIPILDPFLHVLSHLVAFTGTVPGVSSLIGGMVTSPVAGAGYAAEKFASSTAGEVVSPLVDGLIGLVTDGVFREPRTVAERAADAMSMLHSFEVSFSSLDIAGVSLGGIQQAQSLSIKDFAVAVGTTKPTMLRHHRRTLERRRDDPQTPPGDKAAIDEELTRIERQLEHLVPLEKELHKLEARHRWHDDSLSEDERKRMRTLSKTLRERGGAAIDVGSIGVGRLSGKVEAAGLDIAGLHGRVSVPTRSGEYLPADDLIARLRAERTQPPQSDKELVAKSKLDLHTGKITLLKPSDGTPALVVRAGELPTAEVVERQIARLEKLPAYRDSDFLNELRTWPRLLRWLAILESVPREPVDIGGNTIYRRDAAGKERKELGAVQESGEQVRVRRALRARAERFFGLSVKSLALGPAFATLEPGEGVAAPGIRAGVTTLEAGGIRTGATTIGSVSGTDVSLGVAIDPSSLTHTLPAGAADMAREGFERGGVSIGAGSLTVRDVRQPGLSLDRVSVNGVSGRVVPDGDGWRIPALVIASAELQGLLYSDGATSYFANGTTRSGRIDASVRVRTRAGPEPNTREMSELLIDWLHFERIDADHVGMDVAATREKVRTNPDGSIVEKVSGGYRVEATEGALIGLDVSGMRVPMTDPAAPQGAPKPATTGTIGIDRFDSLRFAMLTKALQGRGTTISGTLHGGATPKTPGATPARAVTVRMLETSTGQAERRIDLQGGALLDTTLETADGRVRFRRVGLSGTIGTSGDRTSFEKMGPFDVDIAGIDWTAGTAQVLAKGSTKLIGVQVDGWYESTPTTETTPAGGGTPRRKEGKTTVHLDRLSASRVRSNDLRYVDGVLDVHLGRSGKSGSLDPAERKPDLLSVANVKVLGLHWDSVEGVSGGAVQTGRVAAAFGGRLSGDLDAATRAVSNALHVKGSMTAAGIRVDFLKGGRIMARATGIIGEVGLGSTDAADEHHLKWGDAETGKGLDTGLIDIHGDVIDIGRDGTPGLALETLTLDKLSWNWSAPTGFGLEVPSGGGHVTMGDIRARVRILLHPKGSKEAATGRLKKIVLRELVVGSTAATGLGLRLGDAILRLDPTQIATLGRISLRAPPGEDGFVIEPGRTKDGAPVLAGGLDIARMIDGSDGVSLPNVKVDVARTVTGTADLGVGTVGIDFFGTHGLSVTLTKPSITAIQLALKGDAKLGGKLIHTLSLIRTGSERGKPQYGIRAERVTFTDTDKPGEGPQRRVEVSGLGITGLEYRNSGLGVHIFVPDAKIPNLQHDLESGSGRIDQVDITNASLMLDLMTMLGGPGPAAPSREQRLTTKLNDVATALMPYADVVDSLNGSLEMTIYHDDLKLLIKTTFVDGAFDYRALWRNVLPGLPWYVPALQFRVRHNDLMLGLIGIDPRTDQETIFPVISWPLGSDEAMAKKQHRIKILRALRPSVIYDPRVGGPGPTKRLEIKDVKADLSTKNPDPIPIALGKYGTIVLAPNAIANLKVEGSVGGTSASGRPTGGTLQPISLHRATVATAHLDLGPAAVDTGTIEITGLKDAHLSFSGMFPTVFNGLITKATAKDIVWSIKRTGKAAR